MNYRVNMNYRVKAVSKLHTHLLYVFDIPTGARLTNNLEVFVIADVAYEPPLLMYVCRYLIYINVNCNVSIVLIFILLLFPLKFIYVRSYNLHV